MIDRYSRKEIKEIWEDKNKYSIWLDIELAAAEAMEKLKIIPKGVSRIDHLVNKLLCAALIEARSCERFKLLTEQLEDKELKLFYKKLMISEANHYTMFLNFARKYGDREQVDEKWQSLLDYEAKIINSFSAGKNIHG